jgi:hypothetical protein
LSPLIKGIQYLLNHSESICDKKRNLIKSLIIRWTETVKNLLKYLQKFGRESILTIERFLFKQNFNSYF